MAHPVNKVNSDIFLFFYKIMISPGFHIILVFMWLICYTILSFLIEILYNQFCLNYLNWDEAMDFGSIYLLEQSLGSEICSLFVK